MIFKALIFSISKPCVIKKHRNVSAQPDCGQQQSVSTSTNISNLFLLSFLFLLVILLSTTAHASGQQETSSAQQCNAQTIQAQQQNAPNQLVPASAIQSSEHRRNKTVAAKQRTYRILKRYSHDEEAFTQGLVFHNDALYESTGLLGQSEVRKLDIKTGKTEHSNKLKKYFFGEGISIANDQLVQLTWKSEHVFVYDTKQLDYIKDFKFNGEGWGITAIDDQLLISDGSATLKWLDDEAGKRADIHVSENGVAIQGLNELEYADGFIYANVWPGDCIAQIDPADGEVHAWINLSGLYPETSRPHWTAILNGIAYHRDSETFFVTGKYWPYIYELEFLNTDEIASRK